MKKIQEEFGARLREAMMQAGYEAKPAVLEREFNLRYLGKPMTLHGVRRWLQGETIPGEDKLKVLALWLRVEPQMLRWGSVVQIVREQNHAWECAAKAPEWAIFEAFLKLETAHKKIVRDLILAFSKISN